MSHRATSSIFGKQGYEQFIAQKAKQAEHISLSDRYDAGKQKRVHGTDKVTAQPHWTQRPVVLDTEIYRQVTRHNTGRENREYRRAANDTNPAVVASVTRRVDNARGEDMVQSDLSVDKRAGKTSMTISSPVVQLKSHWVPNPPGVPAAAVRLHPLRQTRAR
jgi:hypothetical protein